MAPGTSCDGFLQRLPAAELSPPSLADPASASLSSSLSVNGASHDAYGPSFGAIDKYFLKLAPFGTKKARNAGFSQRPWRSERRVAELLAAQGGFIHEATLGYRENSHAALVTTT